MNILMVTNTFAPHVSGVARSVTMFTEEFRRRGHRVVVVAPEFDGASADEADVIRLGALRNFAGTDYSVVIGPPLQLAREVDALAPDIIHAHGPFLLGTTAARLARSRGVPLVFSHHTLYEEYTHYVPGNSPLVKRLVMHRATRYANASDAVFAPSRSIADLLHSRGVTAPIYEVPTGVPIETFASGDGAAFRARHGIPVDAIVAGHVGRLAEEKNLDFLGSALALFLAARSDTHVVIVGDGPSREPLAQAFGTAGVAGRVTFTGTLRPLELVDAYHAMDVFAFASLTETQGLVLAEAMAAGVAVVAVNAPGAREIVRDGVNGRLRPRAEMVDFREALEWIVDRPHEEADALRAAARRAADEFALERVADRGLAAYDEIIARAAGRPLTTLESLALAMRGRIGRPSSEEAPPIRRQPGS